MSEQIVEGLTPGYGRLIVTDPPHGERAGIVLPAGVQGRPVRKMVLATDPNDPRDVSPKKGQIVWIMPGCEVEIPRGQGESVIDADCVLAAEDL